MAVVRIETNVCASVAQVFNLARDVDLHVRSTARSNERAIAGRMSGLIGSGETVTWQARHLGVVQTFTSKITAFDPPRYFQDSMTRGAFRSFVHDHWFEERPDGTLMTDVLTFHSPLGILGRLVDWLFLAGYLRRFLVERNAVIKAEAEGAGGGDPVW